MADKASPRLRLLASLVLAFAISALTSPVFIPLLLGGAALLFWYAPMPLLRLRAALGLAWVLMLGLGLMSGQTALYSFGPLTLSSEGLQAGGMIAARMLAIVALVWALLGRLSPQALVAGLRGLHVPALMADMVLLTFRYLSDMQAELARADLARRLRGGADGWRALPDRGMILAASLIRAQDRAERIWAAMRLRGHGAQVPVVAFNRAEWALLALAVTSAVAVVLLDRAI